jgi:hypothetical protein
MHENILKMPAMDQGLLVIAGDRVESVFLAKVRVTFTVNPQAIQFEYLSYLW